MPITTSQHAPRRAILIATSSLAIGVAASSSLGAGAAAGAGMRDSATPAITAVGAASSAEAAIPYLTVLQPRAVRRRGRIVRGRIQLRAIVAANGLKTRWSIREIHRHDGQTTYRVLTHGTLNPTDAKTLAAVAFGPRGSVLRYDVTASNADGGTPTPPQRARIA